jgi:transcriptional regulator with XRE-family HTH domain
MSSRAATPLQAVRLEIGWKQTQTIHALQEAARAQGVPIAAGRSLKTMLSRWENGHDRPDALYQRLLCRIYGRTPDELGFVREDEAAIVLPAVAPTVGPEIVFALPTRHDHPRPYGPVTGACRDPASLRTLRSSSASAGARACSNFGMAITSAAALPTTDDLNPQRGTLHLRR